MTQTEGPAPPLKAKRPSPMRSVEPTFFEALRNITSRWVKRLSRNGHP